VISHEQFRKSSFSGGGGCVEVRLLPDGHIALRDSKDLSLAPNHYTPTAWKAFLTGIRAGEFDVE
jgi:hypothetical protein